MSKFIRYSPELRERAVRRVFEHQGEYESQWTAMVSIGAKIGCTAETLRKWVRTAERAQSLGNALRTRAKINCLLVGSRQDRVIPFTRVPVFLNGQAVHLLVGYRPG